MRLLQWVPRCPHSYLLSPHLPLATTAVNAMVLLTLIPHVRLLQWSTITAMDATVPLTLISYPPHLR